MKKAVSVLLLLAIMVGFTFSANAAVITEDEGNGVMTLNYGVDTHFSVTIPSTVTASGAEGAENEFTISVGPPTIPYGTVLKVKTTYDNTLKLTDQTSVALAYNLWLKSTETDTQIPSGEIALCVPSGTTEVTTATMYSKVTDSPIYSGVYRGTVNFQILVEAAP